MARAKFIVKGPHVRTAFFRCQIRSGGSRRIRRDTRLTAARAIQEGAGWRIDRADAVAGTWLPWEPIDETMYLSASRAKAAIRAWARKNGCRGEK